MNRKLAVPLAVTKIHRGGGVIRTRILKNDDVLDDLEIITKLAHSKARLDRLCEDIKEDPRCRRERPDLTAELDFLETSIKLDLLQLTGELEESPYSEELFEEIVETPFEPALA